jgi:hypothetical protein
MASLSAGNWHINLLKHRDTGELFRKADQAIDIQFRSLWFVYLYAFVQASLYGRVKSREKFNSIPFHLMYSSCLCDAFQLLHWPLDVLDERNRYSVLLPLANWQVVGLVPERR